MERLFSRIRRGSHDRNWLGLTKGWKFQLESRALFDLRVYGNLPLVFDNERLNSIQPQSGPFAERFDGEKGVNILPTNSWEFPEPVSPIGTATTPFLDLVDKERVPLPSMAWIAKVRKADFGGLGEGKDPNKATPFPWGMCLRGMSRASWH